jgi:hypothetical protein
VACWRVLAIQVTCPGLDRVGPFVCKAGGHPVQLAVCVVEDLSTARVSRAATRPWETMFVGIVVSPI